MINTYNTFVTDFPEPRNNTSYLTHAHNQPISKHRLNVSYDTNNTIGGRVNTITHKKKPSPEPCLIAKAFDQGILQNKLIYSW